MKFNIFYALLVRKVRNKYGKDVARVVEKIMDQGNYTHGLWSLVDGFPRFTSNFGTEGERLKYGFIKGFELYIPAPIGASEVIKAASGRFVKTDGSGRVEIAVDGTTELVGHLNYPEGTASATEGGSIGILNVARDAVYRIPVNAGTYAAAMKYDTCDLAVTSSIQGAKLDASGEDTIILVDGDVTNNAWVDCMINPSKLGQTGVV